MSGVGDVEVAQWRTATVTSTATASREAPNLAL
jgi:hypothetical protein